MKKHNTIFLRILCIMLPAIFVSLITIGFSCLFISKHVLLDEVISIAKRNFTQAQKGLLDYNSKIAIAISKISSSNEFKNYKNIITYLIILNYFYKDINILLVFWI